MGGAPLERHATMYVYNHELLFRGHRYKSTKLVLPSRERLHRRYHECFAGASSRPLGLGIVHIGVQRSGDYQRIELYIHTCKTSFFTFRLGGFSGAQRLEVSVSLQEHGRINGGR